MKKRLKRLLVFLLVPLSVIFLLIFYIISLSNTRYSSEDTSTKEAVKDLVTDADAALSGFREASEDPEFRFTVLDVGQGLCCIMQSRGETLIFDGGDRSTSSKVVSYCKEKGISNIKYMVASHYHSDHIYGLVGLIKSGVTVENLIAPSYETDSYAKTALLQLVDNEKIITPYPEQVFQIGGITARCICPVTDDYSDDNGYSVGFIFEYDGLKILVDGDATSESETDMLSADEDLSANILVVPHHGSTYSSSAEWLDKVKPSIAVISCGANNEYFHPHIDTLNRLKDCGVKNLYRTDLNGDVVIDYRDQAITVDTQKKAADEELWKQGEGPEDEAINRSSMWDAKNSKSEAYYIGNKYSKKFHRSSCSQLPDEDKRVLLSDRETALQEGYLPCSVCEP